MDIYVMMFLLTRSENNNTKLIRRKSLRLQRSIMSMTTIEERLCF